MTKYTKEEIDEKGRHDKRYSLADKVDLVIAPRHYKKFDVESKPLHCYTHAVQSLGDINNKIILDLGCGTGTFSVILAKRGAKIVNGIDISEVAISIAKKRSEANQVSDICSFSIGSFYDTGFKDNFFDIVVGMSALHHARDKAKLSDEIFRVLKPEGIAVFNEPFGNSEIMERLRLLVPVKVNEEDKTHWNEQIKYKDLDVFRKKFEINYREFQIFSRLDRIVKWFPFVLFLREIDYFLLKNFAFLRKYARDIVIIFRKRTC